jgi:hypothetical protein
LKRQNNIQVTVCIVFLFICSFFSSPPRKLSAQTGDNANNYYKLVSLYKRYFDLQEELFKKLTFKLSVDQAVKGGTSFKLTLEDNLGKKWIFKEKGTNRVIAQRLYTLFNVESPQIHNVRLVLNGKPVAGTLQRFILNEGSLYKSGFLKISDSGLKYLMKTQVLDWLMRDHDVFPEHFLILSFDQENRAEKLMRIDQDCACMDSELSDLDYVHMVAINKDFKGSVRGNSYCLMEEAHKNREIILDLNDAYALVRFVADFPEELLEELIWPLKEPERKELIKDDFNQLREKYAFFWNSLVSNKRKMAQDFKKLYLNMAAFGDPAFKLSEENSVNKSLEEACNNFEKKIDLLLKEAPGAKRKSAPGPIRISAVASLEGFNVMHRIYKVFLQKKWQLQEECPKALRELEALRAGAQPEERKAIDRYVQEIEKIQSGQEPSFSRDQINKLIDPVPSRH